MKDYQTTIKVQEGPFSYLSDSPSSSSTPLIFNYQSTDFSSIIANPTDGIDKDTRTCLLQDHLVPPFDSPNRPSTLFVGTFNLIATIVGGGVLSLPIVFEKCGVAFTTVAMLLSGCMTYMTLMMLCYCSRRGGGTSYGEVVRSAFGERMEEWTSWLLCVYLMLSVVAYMILIRDIWTPLVQQFLVQLKWVWHNKEEPDQEMDVNGDYVLAVIMALLLPILFRRSLHALRKFCYVGFASICVLCIALCHGGYTKMQMQQNGHHDDHDSTDTNHINEEDNDLFEMQFFKVPSSHDLLFSFPIVTCAFLCHFNIIAIQNALTKPTRRRMQNLTRYAIGACFLLMYAFGLGGYAYGGSQTKGNILLNVPMARTQENGAIDVNYYLFLLGRVGCGITIMIALPMNLLPCREALLEVVDVWFHHSHHRTESDALPEEQCCWKLFRRYNSYESVQDAELTTEDEIFEVLSISTAEGQPAELHHDNECTNPLRASATLLRRHDPIQRDYVFRNTLAHYGSTVLIAAVCYLGAVAVNGVATVWSFIGSSMAFFIAFVIPCGCFVAIESMVPPATEGGDRRDGWIRVAW
eukprot:CAMPEP_0183707506 /NCGR_PEP_ID=MMETSP0737-20130205/4062_1 /TAXON_ID=385413 /ORGANISM="Thalassiosira miniscula, Strain CCMP1093" /LENGTH=578 /DNA_ID=CAMNT_0025935193 /DNA_START=269 /DNA_END=2002 /DNA_ORIENTATION=+